MDKKARVKSYKPANVLYKAIASSSLICGGKWMSLQPQIATAHAETIAVLLIPCRRKFPDACSNSMQCLQACVEHHHTHGYTQVSPVT